MQILPDTSPDLHEQEFKALLHQENAALAMMERGTDDRKHNQLKELISIVKAANVEMPRTDYTRAVKILPCEDNVSPIRSYLVTVQRPNTESTSNDVHNDLPSEEEDFKASRHSIGCFDNCNIVNFASHLEKYELLEFRHLAAHFSKKKREVGGHITLSEQDKLFKHAITTAAASGSNKAVEDPLALFVDI
ncbi:hypothetical protein FRC04_007895 [Tulasnella sp. 424]|nr:hypothetical protein FRC04_007895 [Tulasnella sp. 424]